MKKELKAMKRITALLIIVFMVTALTTVAVGAYNVGDVIGYAQPTDIIATINGYQLKSYNVEGYTYIVAEDLRYYGMKVVYDDSTRTLGVYKDEDVTGINPPMANANYWELGAPSTKKNILYTDIVTYVADNYVTSYNIDGATIIRFDELFRFGEVIYDNEKREISLAIEELNANPVDVFLDYNAANFSKNMEESMSKNMSQIYERNVSCDCLIRARGYAVVFEIRLSGLVISPRDRIEEQESLDAQKEDLKLVYGKWKDYCSMISAFEFDLYDASGDRIGYIYFEV